MRAVGALCGPAFYVPGCLQEQEVVALELQGQLQEARVGSQVLQRQLEEEQEGRARLLEETAYAQESAATVEAALRAELEAAQARQIN